MTKEEFYNEFKDWTKEEMLSRAYDICLKNIELQQRTEKAVEYIEKLSPCMSDDEGGTLYMTSTIWGEDLLNILNGKE